MRTETLWMISPPFVVVQLILMNHNWLFGYATFPLEPYCSGGIRSAISHCSSLYLSRCYPHLTDPTAAATNCNIYLFLYSARQHHHITHPSSLIKLYILFTSLTWNGIGRKQRISLPVGRFGFLKREGEEYSTGCVIGADCMEGHPPSDLVFCSLVSALHAVFQRK
ncbi:hypothetical protein EJ06DRAFT_248970 [Trichodelitschia bisporula]|uniref:Uncharacterized protein n=1 Tax=Trichodelitschia bisporula TaxID=703511 RepID=A0A6G1HJP3_9PEZI|nr:hypothetical protein EJ06DRAFT_248970 [Trichodelitschia bisporula]